MSDLAQSENDVFAEVLQKISVLSASQRRFIHELLAGASSPRAAGQKKMLKKSFGVWADRTDIVDSLSYVNELRAGWDRRTKGIAG